jgi:hypothetical protein
VPGKAEREICAAWVVTRTVFPVRSAARTGSPAAANAVGSTLTPSQKRRSRSPRDIPCRRAFSSVGNMSFPRYTWRRFRRLTSGTSGWKAFARVSSRSDGMCRSVASLCTLSRMIIAGNAFARARKDSGRSASRSGGTESKDMRVRRSDSTTITGETTGFAHLDSEVLEHVPVLRSAEQQDRLTWLHTKTARGDPLANRHVAARRFIEISNASFALCDDGGFLARLAGGETKKQRGTRKAWTTHAHLPWGTADVGRGSSDSADRRGEGTHQARERNRHPAA